MATPAPVTPPVEDKQPAAAPVAPGVATPGAATPPAATEPKPGAMESAIGNRIRGLKPKPETEEEKKKREADEAKAADEKTATDEAAKKAAEKKTDDKAPPAEPEPKVTPAKRVIRRAKDYPVTETTAATDKLATAADKLAAAADKVATAAAPPAPAKPTEPEFNDEEKEMINVFSAMGELDKTKHGHLVESAKKFIAEFPKFEQTFTAKFKEQWERKNPLSKFDDEDERAKAFESDFESEFDKAREDRRKEYGLNYTEREYRAGERVIDTKPILEKQQAQERELDRIRREKEFNESTTSAKEIASSAVADLATTTKTALGEEFDGVIGDDGTLNEAALSKVKDGKRLKPFLQNSVDRSKEFAEAAILVEKGIPTPHEAIIWNAIHRYEQEMSKKPVAQRTNEEGKVFTTIAEFQKMSPADQAKSCYVNSNDLITWANDFLLGVAKQQIADKRAELEDMRKEMGVTAKPPEEKATPPAGGNGKPQSPAGVATPPPTAAPTASDWLKSRFSAPVISGAATP